ncbi:MAG: tyrosine-type recombinase/integrase [Planctomycetes bacterium]|nr:tyrosine-type recombinase/integrase [Planctomycetota bacterium]
MCKKFGGYFEKYLLLPHIRSKSSGTLATEKAFQRRFWRYLEGIAFEGTELEVNRSDAEKYIQHMGESSLQANTIRTAIGILGTFYQEAVRQDWMLKNPFSRLDPPRPVEEPHTILSVKQMKKLLVVPDLTTVNGFRDRVVLELLYSCGLRRSEVSQVKASDFQEGYGSIRVIGKGQKEAVIPVGKMAAHFAAFYCDNVWPRINRDDREELFLSCYTGAPLNDYQVYRIVKEAGVQCGFKETITPHTFRYSIATHLDEEGVDIRYIQEFLRHEDLSTTSRYITQGFHRLQAIHHNTHPREKS